ncbi:conserved putative membrane protein [Candidatus Protochlamydia naegleriophila]|uniref:Conserved putative membrane protein n=1 Tax=Candidatus Protochlamydia naegleriophila TaxID=389348 RepID=A0A0U5EPP4_9BACT|nr:type III secretion system translocon subunit SctE [Candidatus Protochlamydia naegleriophila]CUI15987.1 conserved putative membrane protein [Candidatus Protochlamydia naegleriophila]
MPINSDFSSTATTGDFAFNFTLTSDKTDKASTPQGIGTIGTQAYEDVQDTIGDFTFTPLHFVTLPAYPSPAQSPTLPQPNADTQDFTQQQPYGEVEQKMVTDFFAQNVTKQLQELPLSPPLSTEQKKAVFEAIMNGTMPADPALAFLAKTIGDKATATTQEEGNLPKTWTITSKLANDWTPAPIQPYSAEKQGQINEYYDQTLLDKATNYIESNLITGNAEETAMLIEAIKTGKVAPEIADLYLELTAEARAETQQAFGLSSTWFKGSESVDDWKPINVGIITPAKVSEAKMNAMLSNSEQLFTETQDTAKTFMDSLPPNDPNRVALTEFLKVIGQAIRDLKATLREIQIKDAEKTKENSNAKLDQLADRRLRADEQSKKMDDLQKKQRSMGDMGKVMKVLVPVISAIAMVISTIVSLIVGIGIAVGTFGIGTAAGIAVIIAGVSISAAIGAALLTYSVMDSTMDVTQKAVKLFDKTVRSMLPPDAPDWAVNLVKATIVIAAVAALAAIAILLIVASFVTGSGPAAVASSTVQAALMAIMKSLMQGALQITLMLAAQLLMATKVVPDLISSILKASGVDKETIKNVEIAVTVIQMVVVMAAVVVAGAASGAGAKAAASTATDTAGNIAQAAKTQAQSAAKGLMDLILEPIKNLINSIKEMGNIFSELKGVAKTLVEDGLKAAMKEFLMMVKDRAPDLVNAMAKSLPLGTQMVGGFVTGAYQVQASKLTKDVGELKSLEESIEGMIQALEKLLKNIQSGMAGRDDFIAQLQQLYLQIYNSATKSQANLFNAVQG